MKPIIDEHEKTKLPKDMELLHSRLAIGNKVISTVLNYMPSPGNQIKSYIYNDDEDERAKINTNSIIAFQEGTTYIEEREGLYYRPIIQSEIDYKPERSAGIALHYGAGNCQEYAAVTYELLKQELTQRSSTLLIKGGEIGQRHYYCVIVNTGNTDLKSQYFIIPNDAVVVDPWVMSKTNVAVFWQDSVHMHIYKPAEILFTGTGEKKTITKAFLESEIYDISAILSKFINYKYTKPKVPGRIQKSNVENKVLLKQLQNKTLYNDYELVRDEITTMNVAAQQLYMIVREKVNEYITRAPRVKHGANAGQPPRDLRDIKTRLDRVKITEITYDEIQDIYQYIAHILGINHGLTQTMRDEMSRLVMLNL
ncbi:hypothetical protein Trichorick_01604 (plasmid) [Candidatus Trichorickettsia mobilis]|uniref:hypothetical protein n=1 Tax=Candidatus Trichorickettsia mobilis TaxID=1346319 RepID=UPI002B257CEB|nr:hypothetical protein [Candidatus Trichorickettsia mobilis]WPY01686.1 hypothetical protein Trichorick_01604 [Candidatus Trichorickettsia mobilis]